MIEKGLQGKVFVKDTDGTFIILGQDAIEKAIESELNRPNAPCTAASSGRRKKKPNACWRTYCRKFAARPANRTRNMVFCIPAQPVDQEDDEFDVGYH
jgi:hypothetical protein